MSVASTRTAGHSAGLGTCSAFTHTRISGRFSSITFPMYSEAICGDTRSGDSSNSCGAAAG